MAMALGIMNMTSLNSIHLEMDRLIPYFKEKETEAQR